MIHLFLDCNHPKHCYIHHLPYPGKILQQGAITMAVFRVLRREFIQHQNEQIKK